jgi:Zn-finger nucleic acid-binding protein
MTCVNCGASMRLDRGKGLMVCPYCRTEAVPPVGEDGVQILGGTKYPCPICQGETLSDGVIEGEPLFYCQKCRGMLIGIDRFLPLVENLRAMRDRPAQYLAPRSEADADRGLVCPLCSKTMEAHPYGGPGNVYLDTCEPCERLWLDDSELRRIVVAADPKPVYSKV